MGTAPSAADRMSADWDARARENPYHYVSSGRETWSRDEFYASGWESVQGSILSDLGRITQGRDPKQMRILELGCGPGRMTLSLADIFGEVVAVDVSGEMLALAREALHDRPNVKLFQTNGCDLSALGSIEVDFAFSFIVFQHIPQIEIVESYVGEVARLLRPGGMFKFQVQGAWRSSAKPPDTWEGVSVSGSKILSWLDRYRFDLIDFEGVGTQYEWLWMRKRTDDQQARGQSTADNSAAPEDPQLSTRIKLLQSEIEQLGAECERRIRWAQRLDRELEALREHVRRIYASPAYRVGRRIKLAPEPFDYEPEEDPDR